MMLTEPKTVVTRFERVGDLSKLRQLQSGTDAGEFFGTGFCTCTSQFQGRQALGDLRMSELISSLILCSSGLAVCGLLGD